MEEAFGGVETAVVAVLVEQRPLRFLAPVAAGERGVDDEIGADQRLLAVGRLLESEVAAQLGGVADRQGRHRRQPLGVDVDEDDRTAAQSGGEAEVADQAERELGAAGADDGDADRGGHRSGLLGG